jgi:hypothetical protein
MLLELCTSARYHSLSELFFNDNFTKVSMMRCLGRVWLGLAGILPASACFEELIVERDVTSARKDSRKPQYHTPIIRDELLGLLVVHLRKVPGLSRSSSCVGLAESRDLPDRLVSRTLGEREKSRMSSRIGDGIGKRGSSTIVVCMDRDYGGDNNAQLD